MLINIFKTICHVVSKFRRNSYFSEDIFLVDKPPASLSKLFRYKDIFGNSMDSFNLAPPSSVRNMTSLDRAAFKKVVSIPTISFAKDEFYIVKKSKKFLLKAPKLKSIRGVGSSEELKEILLNPRLIKSKEDIKSLMDIDLDKINGKFSIIQVTLTYDNWKCDDILKAVLPETRETSSSYSIIGHIISLNLREHLLPYKTLIGQVYLDKIPSVSMVVNKADIIDNFDNTFRSFAMEKLAGDTDETLVTVQENNCTYKFDFSKVYWNPRLSTEHERIVNKLNTGDILFDVMAGVGPFAIPCAKKKCTVFANDLNPSSYEALKDNCTTNKVCSRVECFNMDGKEFIKSVLKERILLYLNDNTFSGHFHITMNLPSIAVEFLPAFVGLLNSVNAPSVVQSLENMYLPVIHVYLFSVNEAKEYVAHKVASKIGYCFQEISVKNERDIDISQIKDNIKPEFWEHVLEIVSVRKVAPAKVMFRVTFRLPLDVLHQNSEWSQHKKIKLGL